MIVKETDKGVTYTWEDDDERDYLLAQSIFFRSRSTTTNRDTLSMKDTKTQHA